jgi:hypothetical protein
MVQARENNIPPATCAPLPARQAIRSLSESLWLAPKLRHSILSLGQRPRISRAGTSAESASQHLSKSRLQRSFAIQSKALGRCPRLSCVGAFSAKRWKGKVELFGIAPINFVCQAEAFASPRSGERIEVTGIAFSLSQSAIQCVNCLRWIGSPESKPNMAVF